MKTVLTNKAVTPKINNNPTTKNTRADSILRVKKAKLIAQKRTRRSKGFALSRLSMALLTVLGADPLMAATYSWAGPNGGNWDVASNWTGGNDFSFLDDIDLNIFDTNVRGSYNVGSISGSGNLNMGFNSQLIVLGNANLGGLNVNGGTYTTNGLTVVTKNMNWGNGTLSSSHSGEIRVLGSLLMNEQFSDRKLSGNLRLDGTSTLSDNRGISFEGGRIVNTRRWIDASTGDISFARAIDASIDTVGVFDNNGLFEKNSAFTTTFANGVSFNNVGSVIINAGKLSLAGGGDSTRGLFEIANGATLEVGNSLSSYTLGRNVVNNGTLKIGSGTILANQGLSLGGTTDIRGELVLGAASNFNNVILRDFARLRSNSTSEIAGSLQWLNGAIAGNGVTSISGDITMSGTPSGYHVLESRHTLEALGNTNIDGAHFVNRGTWLDSSTLGSSIRGNASTNTGGAFENQGTYTKSQNSTTNIGEHGLTFINSGTVNINAGTLRITADGTNTGVFNIAAGSTLDFHAGAYLFNTGNVNNEGTFKVSGATVTATQGLNLGGLTEIRGGTLNLQAGSSMSDLTIVSGARLNNNAILSVAGASFFSSGIIAGAGTTVINGSLSLVGNSNNKLMDGQTLITKGITNIGVALSGNPTLAVFNGASVINQGDWNIGRDGVIATSFAPAISGDANSNTGGVFENQGTFNKSNPLISAEIGKHGLAFNNTGIVNVNAGKLAILGGGTSAGQINIGSAGTLDFLTTAYNVGRNVSNAGFLRVSNGGILNASDGLNLGGRTVLTNGTLNLGATSIIGNLTVDSTSALNINAGVLSTGFASNNQGTINIASGAELNYRGIFNNAGTITGNGAVRTQNTLTNAGSLSPGALNSIGQLSIFGNLTQTSAGQINIDLARTAADLLAISGTATLSGTLNVNVTEELARGSNYKVLTWAERTANSEFDSISFAQAANYRLGTTYDVDGLTVSMKGYNYYWSGPENGGLWNLDPHWTGGNGGRPQAGDGAFLGRANTRLNNIQQIAEIVGAGTLTLAGGADLRLSERANLGGLVLDYQSNFQNNGYAVVSGATYWQGGTLSGSGTTRFEGDTTVAESTHAIMNGHTIEFAGNTIHTGGIIYTGQGSHLMNLGTWTDQNTGFNSISNGLGGASSTFENLGTYNKASSSEFDIGGGVTFNNTGTLNVNAGTLRFSDGFNSTTGQINIANGATLRLSTGNANVKGTINNAGTLSVPGVLNTAGNLLVQGGQTMLNGNGTINNGHLLRLAGDFFWGQGTIRGAGTTRFDGNTTLGESTHAIMNGHTIEFAGNTNHTGGIIYTGQGSRLINLGIWTEQNTGHNSLSNGYGGANSSFENIGTFNKASNSEFVIGGGTDFNNSGTLNVNAGTLRFSDGFNSTTGQINIASGAVLSFNAGNANLKGTINNAGTLKVEGRGVFNPIDSLIVQGGQTILNDSTINNTHSLRITGAFDWKQGTITGAGTTRLEGNTTLSESTHAVMNGHTIEFTGDTDHTGGIIYTSQGSRLVNIGTWHDKNTGNIDISNGFGGANSSFDNQGTFIKTGGAMTTFGGDLTLNNLGSIQINAGTLRLLGNFNNQGKINVAAGAEFSGQTAVFGNAGTLTGDGTVRTANSLTNTGILAAGGLDNAGHLSLIGNLAQATTGQFLVDLGGINAGEFDLFSITGNALLGGTLAINLLDGVNFKVGDSFTVMTWNQRLNNSQFANLDFTQANGYLFNAEYNNNDLTLRVVTVPVPEPASALLLGLGLLGLAGLSRKQRTTA